MKYRIAVYPDKTSLAKAAASVFADAFKRSVTGKGSFDAVLSGGETPLLLYSLLASEYRARLDWTKAHFFWGDERCVPPVSAESNYNSAKASLLSKIEIPPNNVHRIKGELPPIEAAKAYEKDLVSHFGLSGQMLPSFDLVLLGLGADGHTLSLFPGTKALDEKERLVVENHVGKLNSWRVTMTLRAIEKARQIIFLVSGEGKAAVLKDVLDGKDYPAALVAGKEVLWMVDSEAGLLIDS